MVAYSFQPDFHLAILAGDKTFTLRQHGKRPHARIGQPITFMAGRGKPTFARGECVYRATVVFSAVGLHRVHSEFFLPPSEPLRRLLHAAEQGSPNVAPHLNVLATRDGFDSWADMAAWHVDHGVVEGGRIYRELIGWDPATVKAVETV